MNCGCQGEEAGRSRKETSRREEVTGKNQEGVGPSFLLQPRGFSLVPNRERLAEGNVVYGVSAWPD